jgi:hypothetical protein
MKAITVKDPYGWAIAYAGKTTENRSRPTSYRGPLAIHVGLGWDAAGAASSLIQQAWARWASSVPLHPGPGVEYSGYPGRLERGGLWLNPGDVIAIADLVDCHPADGCCESWGEPDGYHLTLDNVHRIRPVPAKGQLGVPWNLPGDVAIQVEAQIGVAS